jgi:carbonic anhydrase
MNHVKPLPDRLAERYRAWRAGTFEANRAAYATLARDGQAPEVMIISCCDSRVLVSEMFCAAAGDYFVHRNIAALVPPHGSADGAHGTLSTIEYAVTTLAVRHILVVGHSGCGGVAGCHDLCRGEAPALADPASYVGMWLQLLVPAFERVRHLEHRAERLEALEREAVRVSLDNLMTLPFVRDKVATGAVALHGAWKNIAEGMLEVVDPATGAFVALR